MPRPFRNFPAENAGGQSSRSESGRHKLIYVLLILFIGAAAYSSSFRGAFVFDDRHAIVENETLQNLSHYGLRAIVSPRILTDLTFAANYAAGKLNPAGYHAVNLSIHLACALVFFLILLHTFETRRLSQFFGRGREQIAFAAALIWCVHPLTTQSVVYVVQRAESLMGLFYLLTLYFSIRYFENPKSRSMSLLAFSSCALGMAAKQVMITAPVAVLLYDRIFFSGSWKSLARTRSGFYLFLFASWGILFWLTMNTADTGKEISAGFSYKEITPLQYAMTEPRVLLHYLRLSLWPHPLVLDYGWPAAHSMISEIFPMILLAILLVVTIWALAFHPPAGYAAALFFLILAPTSSFIPIADPAFEQRMYLPLAAVVTLFCAALFKILRSPGARSVLIAFIVLTFSFLTFRRGALYGDELLLWQDTAAKRPGNARAQYNVGFEFEKRWKLHEAVLKYEEALRLKPDYAEAHTNLAMTLSKSGKSAEAVEHYKKALEIRPDSFKALFNYGLVLADAGNLEEAASYFKKAAAVKPESARIHHLLGSILLREGKAFEADEQFRETLRLESDYVEKNVKRLEDAAHTAQREGNVSSASAFRAQAEELKKTFSSYS